MAGELPGFGSSYMHGGALPNMRMEPTRWLVTTRGSPEAGDVAIQTGQYHLTALGSNGDGEDKGRFVTVWKKVDGEWKVAHDISSTTMPEVQTVKK